MKGNETDLVDAVWIVFVAEQERQRADVVLLGGDV